MNTLATWFRSIYAALILTSCSPADVELEEEIAVVAIDEIVKLETQNHDGR